MCQCDFVSCKHCFTRQNSVKTNFVEQQFRKQLCFGFQNLCWNMISTYTLCLCACDSQLWQLPVCVFPFNLLIHMNNKLALKFFLERAKFKFPLWPHNPQRMVQCLWLELVGLTSTHSLGSGTQLHWSGWILNFSDVAHREWWRACLSPSISGVTCCSLPQVNKKVLFLCPQVRDRSLTLISAWGPDSKAAHLTFCWSLGRVLDSALIEASIVLLGDFIAHMSCACGSSSPRPLFLTGKKWLSLFGSVEKPCLRRRGYGSWGS